MSVEAFETSGIVPDILDSSPPEILKVSYNSGIELAPGNELTPTQVKDQPTVQYNGDTGAFYTLLLTDLDAPSKTVRRIIKIINDY
jgi:hypothetical protein